MLVVGTGQSGAQIAEDLHLEGRQVHLAVGSAPRVARFYRGRDCMTWLADMGLYDKPAPEYPGGKAAIEKTNHYVTGRDGGRDIDLRRFAAEGMRLYGTLGDGKDARLTFEPSLQRRRSTRPTRSTTRSAPTSTRYIEREGIDGAAGHPVHPGLGARGRRHRTRPGRRGRHQHRLGDRLPARLPVDRGQRLRRRRPADAEPRASRRSTGLSFVGLPWMHTWGSGRFLGVDRDAKHIATTIIDDLRRQSATSAHRRLAVAR